MQAVICFLCNARMDIENEDVGKLIRCPFCEAPYVVVKYGSRLVIEHPEVDISQLRATRDPQGPAGISP